MRKRTASLVLTGALVTGAVGAAVAVTPASAATSADPVTSRLAAIRHALTGLVEDGTLTRSQADRVASTLDEALPARGHDGAGDRFGPPGARATWDAAAKALGVTPEGLRTSLEGGRTIAAVATEKGVEVSSVVTAMVDAAKSEVAAAVKNGHLTRAQADAMTTSLTARVTDMVNGVRPDHEEGVGRHGGHGPRGGDGDSSTRPPTGSSSTSSGGTSASPTSLPSLT